MKLPENDKIQLEINYLLMEKLWVHILVMSAQLRSNIFLET